MTFSIVARSADGAELGVAVASKFLAVGAVVPAAESEVGALATQSYANLAYRPQGLVMLRTGTDAAGTVAALTAGDPDRERRQLGVVAAAPGAAGATFTGAECHEWAGGVTGDGYAIQGNILAGPQVVTAMERAWQSGGQDSLARRLVAALAAGDAVGGDRRGRQSAALLVVARGAGYGGLSDVAVDVRVDDHTDPVGELARLLKLHERYFGSVDPAAALPLTGPLAEEVREQLARLGHPPAPGPDGLDAALASWAGVENLEERLVAGRIDAIVLETLREG